MCAAVTMAVVDEATDGRDRLVHRQVVDRHAEQQCRWSRCVPACHVVSTFRAVLVQVTEFGRIRTRNQSLIFQAISRGACRSAR